MDDVKVTITNLDGNFALFTQDAAAIEEVERYDTLEGATAVATTMLGDEPRKLFVVDRKGKSEAYRVDWLGREKVAEQAVNANEPEAEPEAEEPDAE